MSPTRRRLAETKSSAGPATHIEMTFSHRLPNPIIRKLESIFALSDEEKAALSRLPVQITTIGRGQDIVREGERPTRSFALLDGFTHTYKVIGSGKRQIVAVHVPGDIPDLQSMHLPRLDVSIGTLARCEVVFMQHQILRQLCQQYPRIGAALWRETLIEASVSREWTANNGQRPGTSRIAHILCELTFRLRAVDLVEGNVCTIPMTQAELGDATGMSAVHVNRCLQDLRAGGLIRLTGNHLEIPDWSAMTAVADFDPAYLHLRDKAPE